MIRGAVRSDVGRKRRNNEDSFGFFPDLSLFVVADGMGGHAAGQVASALAVDALRHSLLETADDDLTPISDASGCYSVGGRRLTIAVDSANHSVLEASRKDPAMSGMGTTLAAVLFDRPCDSVAICHVGDSRVYRIRGEAIEQLTHDHTVVQRLVDDGRLRAEDAAMSQHRHVLTQAVGSTDILHPDLRLERPEPGDVFVLCSDGVHDLVAPEDILGIVRGHAQDLDRACAEVIDLANDRGGNDNSTVLMVACEEAAHSHENDPTLAT